MTCKMTSTEAYSSFAELEDKFWFQREPLVLVMNGDLCRMEQQYESTKMWKYNDPLESPQLYKYLKHMNCYKWQHLSGLYLLLFCEITKATPCWMCELKLLILFWQKL